MAIPTGDITRIFAHHLLAAYHHILQNFVQRMTNMQMSVSIGGPVMQGEIFASCFFPQAIINTYTFPARQPVRFAFRQPCPHRKCGFWQVQCVFVFGDLVRHLGTFQGSVLDNSGWVGRGGGMSQTPNPGSSSRLERRACNSVYEVLSKVHRQCL